jgi:hypothetical protein
MLDLNKFITPNNSSNKFIFSMAVPPIVTICDFALDFLEPLLQIDRVIVSSTAVPTAFFLFYELND